jgi:hypothetical protein
MLVCFIISHARLRMHWAPGFPCALCLLRDSFLAKLGRYLRRENAESHLEFHVIVSEAKQSIFAEQRKRRMDCFAEPVIRRRFGPTGWLTMMEGSRDIPTRRL